jgi:hypothetical protein
VIRLRRAQPIRAASERLSRASPRSARLTARRPPVKWRAGPLPGEMPLGLQRPWPVVGGYFSFYPFPTSDYWTRLFGSTPPTFALGFKVPEQITVQRWPGHARYGPRGAAQRTLSFWMPPCSRAPSSSPWSRTAPTPGQRAVVNCPAERCGRPMPPGAFRQPRTARRARLAGPSAAADTRTAAGSTPGPTASPSPSSTPRCPSICSAA